MCDLESDSVPKQDKPTDRFAPASNNCADEPVFVSKCLLAELENPSIIEPARIAENTGFMYTLDLLGRRERVAMANKSKRDAVISNRKDLAEHVEAFLKAGGKVQQIPSGVSGQTSTSGPRQIVLSHKTS